MRKGFNSFAAFLFCLLTCLIPLPKASAQITNVVFSEDFTSNVVNTNKFQKDSPFFEGGQGNFDIQAANGVVEFTGEVTTQWWPGATLQLAPTFIVSEQTNIIFSVDRVAEMGVGTASRSAMWVMDDTKARYILFADVRAESGWRFNRKIGISGDNPTGGGTDIALYNGAAFDDGGLHQMKMVANGRTVRLYLDNLAGPEVTFPFTNLIFQFGSFARANADLAHTIFDNIKVESVGKATFSSTAISLKAGETLSNLTVRIPPGVNATAPVQIRVVSATPAVAIPVGAVNGTLTLTFPAGGPNTQTFAARALDTGGSAFSLQSDIGLQSGNTLNVTVLLGPGLRLEENFAGSTLDTNKWQISQRPFEVGVGVFEVKPSNGTLEISGTTTEAQYWAGASLKTAKNYVATKDLNLVFEMDRVSIEQAGTAGRTGVLITSDDRSRYVLFAQNVGENNWQVNVNPGNPTGSGTALAPFSTITNTGAHKMKLVADGENVDIYLDGQLGGRYPFAASSGIYFEIAAFARAIDDTVKGVFDNIKIENTLPCITVSSPDVSMIQGEQTQPITVTIPKLLNSTTPVQVTITSRDAKVAVPTGATGGTLTLSFAAGATNTQTFTVSGVGVGNTTFDISGGTGACVRDSVKVGVAPAPQTLLADDFSKSSIDNTKWRIDENPFETGGLRAGEYDVSATNGMARIFATADFNAWPGLALFTKDTFPAGATTPLTFEIDRVKLDFQLVTGTSAKQLIGFWISNADRSTNIFFSDYATHDGAASGWQYHRNIGQAGDNPTGAGVALQPFAPANFNDRGKHRVKMVANGSTVKLYLDDVLGGEVPFPLTQGIAFGFGSYVLAANDIVIGTFDNAKITGGVALSQDLGRITVLRQGNNAVISWTGDGVLQAANSLTAPITWVDVTPAPTGKSYTTTPSQSQRYFRLRK
jgi:hypothetical protein